MQLIGCLSLAVWLVQAAAVPPRNTDPLPVAAQPIVVGCAVPDSLPVHLRALLNDTVATATHRLLHWHDLRATRAFYQRRAYAPAWSAGPTTGPTGQAALALLLQAEDYGLQPANYHAPALRALATQLALPDTNRARLLGRQARFEGLLTDGLLRFAQHLHRGQLRECTPSPLETPTALFEPDVWLAQALAAPEFVPALLRCQPQQREYQLLQQALARWLRQPAGPDSLARQRRAQQMAVTLERWRWRAIPAPDSAYVLVNLPAYALEVVRQGQVVQPTASLSVNPKVPRLRSAASSGLSPLRPNGAYPTALPPRNCCPSCATTPASPKPIITSSTTPKMSGWKPLM